MPALQPYIIEPIWEQFEALLPERRTNHPLGCHRPRVPDRVVFGKLVEMLVFGCAYWRIADESCSESTLRRRRDEWIGLGLMEKLREISLGAYDRLIGLELSDLAVDGCITKAPCGLPAAARKQGGARWIGEKKAQNARRTWWMGRVSPSGPSSPRPTVTTRAALGRDPPRRLRAAREAARSGERASRPRLRLEGYPREARGPRSERRDRREGQARPAAGCETLGRGTHELVAQRPQEAGVVYREVWAGDRLLGGVLGCGHHREATHPRRLEPLPLGKPTFPTTMTY